MAPDRGLMVYLHGAESGQTMRRVTTDADILIRVKVIHDGTRQVATWLQERGLEFEGASAMEIGHRFSGGGISVDVLVQGHLGVRAERRTVGQNRAPEAPGGTALQAAGEVVPIITSTGGLVQYLVRRYQQRSSGSRRLRFGCHRRSDMSRILRFCSACL